MAKSYVSMIVLAIILVVLAYAFASIISMNSASNTSPSSRKLIQRDTGLDAANLTGGDHTMRDEEIMTSNPAYTPIRDRFSYENPVIVNVSTESANYWKDRFNAYPLAIHGGVPTDSA